MTLDLVGINDYFKSFKDDEKGGILKGSAAFSSKNNLLPPVEVIIKESLKVKLNKDSLDEL